MVNYTKIIIAVTSIVTTLSYSTLKAQASQFIENTENYRNSVSTHLTDIMSKSKDLTYKGMLIPKAPVEAMDNAKISTLNTHFPYPVILVHGLASSSDTWLDLYNYVLSQGWSYGGRMDFCLNSDANNSVANLTTDITDYTGSLTNSDFYLVNFDVNPNGTAFSNTVLSNQAAIYKQGVAMKKAINHVLTVTGKDKVIILVHSMGGLATRQYLQNSNLWQPDGQHHIAKLATLGTPHGGSNMSGTFVLNWAFPPNMSSDAVRDLRRSYFYSGDPGVFLHGGLEDYDVMWDALFSDFYNDDVNCNGVDGDNIVGLDQKSISTNLDYACLYGDYSLALTPGDGIVSIYDSQLKNFYPTLTAETFTCTKNHVALTPLIKEEYLCIDEPDEFSLGYTVNKDTLYNGFITTQANDCAYITDYDQYNFKVQQAGNIQVKLGNWKVQPYRIKLLDANFNTVLTQTYTTLTATTVAVPVTSGKYYMQLSALPNDTSWKYPYNYKIMFTPAVTTSITEEIKASNILVSPNPVESELNITVNNEFEENLEIKISNILGQTVYSTSTNDKSINKKIELSNALNGVYFINLNGKNTRYTSKFIKAN